MSQEDSADTPHAWRPTPAQVVAYRVRELRKRRGWTAERLASECARVGMSHLNRPIIANLEGGRRASISVDELFALAYVLDVAPINLLLPIAATVDHHTLGQVHVADYQVTPTVSESVRDVRKWVHGYEALDGTNKTIFREQQPEESTSTTGLTPVQALDQIAKMLSEVRETTEGAD